MPIGLYVERFEEPTKELEQAATRSPLTSHSAVGDGPGNSANRQVQAAPLQLSCL